MSDKPKERYTLRIPVEQQHIACPFCNRLVIRECTWTGPHTMNARLLTPKGRKPHRCKKMRNPNV